MLERTTLEPLAAQHVRELRDTFGVECTLEDILWLHDLAKRVMRPGGAPHAGLAGAPVCVGNVKLWPFTIGASEWWMTIAMPACEGRKPMDTMLATAFAMAHARDPEALLPIATWDQLEWALGVFRFKLGVRIQELTEAVHAVFARETLAAPPKDADPKAADRDAVAIYRGVIARLMVAYPGTGEGYWRWGLARCEALRMIASYHEQKAPPGKTGGSGKDSNFEAFIAARAQILREHRERKAKAEAAGSLAETQRGMSSGGPDSASSASPREASAGRAG